MPHYPHLGHIVGKDRAIVTWARDFFPLNQIGHYFVAPKKLYLKHYKEINVPD